MPVDKTMPERTAHHRDGIAPYLCHAWPTKPGAAWGIDYGYCRHSLDVLIGRDDPRCPVDCPHKAPAAVVVMFDKLFGWRGAAAAAQWAREARG